MEIAVWREQMMLIQMRSVMTKELDVCRCPVCGIVVETLHAGAGALVCCGMPMQMLELRAGGDNGREHALAIARTGNSYKVHVGSHVHPMEAQHYIEWIELIADGQTYRLFLRPGGQARAAFRVKAEQVSARALCSVHGLYSL